MSGGARPLRPAEAALSLLLSPPGKAGNDEAQLQLLRRLQEFPESFLPPAQQQQHCRHHPHHHCQEVEGHGTPGGWQETQKLIAALLSLVSSPSTSSSSSPANLELRVHATLALTTLLVLSQPPANDGSGDDGDDDWRAAAAAALAHALSRTASTLLQLVASSQHQQKRQQQKRVGAERGAVLPAPLRRVALEGLVELETAFPGLLWEEREQLKALAAGTTVGVAALLALVLANGTAAGGGGITRSGGGGSRTRVPAGDVAAASNGNAAGAAANLNAAGVSAGADAGATSRERGTGSTSTATATATTAAAAASAETRASIAAVLDRLPLLSPPRQLLAARRLAAAASASRVPPVVFKPQLLRLMASSEPPLVAAALLMKRAFGDALFAPDEEALLARRLAVVAAHPGAAAADGTRMLASQWLLRFPENSPLHDDDDGGSGGGRDAVTGCCECDGSVGSNTSGGDGVGPDCSASGGVDGYGGDAGGRYAAVGGDGCGGCCHGIAGGRGGTVRAPLSLAPAIAASLFPTVFQGCPPLFPPSSRSSSREDGASTAYLLLSRFQLLCLIHCEDDFGEAHGESGAGEGADRLLGCLRAMASDLARRSRQRRQQQQNKRQQQKRRQQQRSVPCPFFGAALLYFRHFRHNAPALCGLLQLLLDAFVEDVRLSPRVVRLVDRMQEEEEAAEALAVATALESSSSTSSSTSSLTSASPPPASPRGGGFPVQLLRSLQEAIVGAASGPRSQPLQRPLERLPYELLVLERAAREPRVPAAPALIFLLRLVSPEAGPAAGVPGVLGDWEGGCGVLAVCRHLLARPGGGAADAVAAPLLSRLLLTLAQSPLCDVDVRDRARALAGLQAALSPAKLRALLSAPPAAAAAAVARCGRHHRRDHRHNDVAAPVPASPIAEVPCLVPLAEPALALALVDPDRDGGDDVAGVDVAGDVNEEDALPVYLRWLRGDKNGGNWGGRPDEAQVGLRVALRDDWSRRHGRVYAVQLNFVGARAEDVRLPYLGPAGNDGTGGRTARLRLSWLRGSRRYRDVTLAPTAVFVDGLGRTCRCRLPTLSVPLASLLQPLAPALSPGARSRLFEELWALFTTTAADAAASDGSQILDCDDDDDVIDPAACAQSVLRLDGGAGSEGAAAGEAARGAAAERLERGLHRFAVSVRDGGRRRDADGDRGPAGRRAFWAAMMLPPGRHILVRVTGARVQKGGSGCGAGGGSGPAAVLVTVATDDWRLLPLIGSHLAKVARVKGEGL